MISQRRQDAFINLLRSAYNNSQHSTLRLTARRPTTPLPTSPRFSARRLSHLSHYTSRPWSSSGCRPVLEGSSVACNGQKQPYATTRTNQSEPRQIAVLGAGITGLTAAHYLARHAENAHITIYEASDRPGGWIKANRVEVKDDNGNQGHVLFQNGPRMLRSGSSSTKYDDLVLYDVLASLDMVDKIRHPKAVSDTRYLYYPDHLVKLPSAEISVDNIVGAIQSYLTEPIWSGGLRAAYNFWKSYNNTLNPDYRSARKQIGGFEEADESVAQFLERVLKDDRVVHNIVSGVMHGIYGGDVNKLSAKHTMLDRLWYHFQRPLSPAQEASWVDSKEMYLLFDMLSGPNRYKIIELAESAVDWKLLAFEDGLVSLVKGLEDDLKAKSNVTFKYNEPITSLKHEKGKVLVTTPRTKTPLQYDHAICTLFSKHLAEITEPQNSLPSLAETHAVTIMVVNLWYPNPNLLAEGGFGYLIPSSTPDNDYGALGVLFDSDLRTDDSEMPGTKLTVMLGGHYWDDHWDDQPSDDEGIDMATEVVQEQLGISRHERVVAGARLCRDCLPQHFVGHRDRMNRAHYELLGAFQGHLTVAGPSYTTIGVIPSMRAGFDAAMRVARGHGQPWFRVPEQHRVTPENVFPQSPELDWWASHITAGEKADTVGQTGLEHFTEQEWKNLRFAVLNTLPFRKFSSDEARFLDDEGQFLDIERRRLKNAPPLWVKGVAVKSGSIWRSL